MKKLILIITSLLIGVTTFSQTSSKAWELGVGGTVMQFNRVSFSNFEDLGENGYRFGLKLDQVVWGGHIYAARELNKHFYLDLQSSVGTLKQLDQQKYLFSGGLGLQWRLGEYFHSSYIDPYLRVGGNYLHKDFSLNYVGTTGLSDDQMSWILENQSNKSGTDRNNMFTASAGVGINMWMNDRLGIGLEGNYHVMPYKNVANSLQGTVRLIWRIGGRTKKPAAEPVYIERIVEREVEIVKEVPVEVPGPQEKIYVLLSNIHFDFDKNDLKPEYDTTINDIADIIRNNGDKYYLITGYTDVKGSSSYNMNVSRERAHSVYKALIGKGISPSRLKYRGVGSAVSSASTSAPNNVREGDRKVTIEIITNRDYWKYLKF